MKTAKIIVMLSIIAIIGCDKANTDTQAQQNEEYEALKLEVQNSDEFLSYQMSFNAFFEAIRNHEYDFFTVYDFTKNIGVAFNCSVKIPNELLYLEGVEIYWNDRCAYERNFASLLNSYPKLKKLTKEQFLYITTSEKNETSLRDWDCLDEFHFDVAVAEQWNNGHFTDGEHSTLNYDNAVNDYEDCCKDNGPGCP